MNNDLNIPILNSANHTADCDLHAARIVPAYNLDPRHLRCINCNTITFLPKGH